MTSLKESTLDYAVLAAQKYLSAFPGFAHVAHVLTAETETVVGAASEWQKRNG